MDLKPFRISLGKRIRAIRKSKKMSQEKLAELSGLHPTYISDVELGKVNAAAYYCFAIAQALDVPFADIVSISTGKDKELEEELAILSGLIKELDEDKRKTVLAGLRGMVTAIAKLGDSRNKG